IDSRVREAGTQGRIPPSQHDGGHDRSHSEEIYVTERHGNLLPHRARRDGGLRTDFAPSATQTIKSPRDGAYNSHNLARGRAFASRWVSLVLARNRLAICAICPSSYGAIERRSTFASATV